MQTIDWRQSYGVMTRDWIDELRSYRKRGLSMVYDVDGEQVRAYELTEQQIHELAPRLAEQDVQRAINKHNESAERNKARKGYAA